MFYKRQDLLKLHDDMGSALIFSEVRVANLFTFFLCCVVFFTYFFSLFFFVLRLSYPMLLVSLDCTFMNFPSVFFNVIIYITVVYVVLQLCPFSIGLQQVLFGMWCFLVDCDFIISPSFAMT